MMRHSLKSLLRLAPAYLCLCFAQLPLAQAAPAAPTVPTAALPTGWVLIETKGKSFLMGQEFAGHRWTYTYPVHPVAFTYDFTMSATQVTQGQYTQVTGVNPTLHPGDEKRPVDNVSWFDAVLYCNALSQRDGLTPVYKYSEIKRSEAKEVTELVDLTINLRRDGYRLLTSAEYEFVTRGGTTGRWFFGDNDEDQAKAVEFAWCDRNSEHTTHPVATLKPNVFGVYDITGNLWMWCNDWYGGAYPTSPQTDPAGPATGDERIARGGAFKNDVYHERSAYHWQWTPKSKNFEVGFRIARTLRNAPVKPLKLADINQAAWYRIVARHSRKCLEIEGGEAAKESGRALQQDDFNGASNQLFQLRDGPSGYYQIFVQHCGKVLQIKDNSLADHAPIEQADATGGDNQLFTLIKDTDDSYSIVAKSSGYCFDVLGGVSSMANHAAVVVYPASNALNHKFQLLDASLPDRAPNVAPLAKVPAYQPPFDGVKAGLTSLFDGKTLEGWVGDPACWKVLDGAIVGIKGNQNIMTTADYDDFRLLVSSIQVDSPTNHQGVGFWGDRLPAGQYGYGGCLDLMPPMNWTWDYTTNRGAAGVMLLSRDLDKDLGLTRSEWTQAEILVNRAKGTIRMAVNGIEVLSYRDRDPKRFKMGPIGLQAHAGNHDVRYKDIYIEVAPKDNRLITLKN